MDSQNKDNSIKKFDEKSLEKLQIRSVIADPGIMHLFKKTERISAALYLITNLIKDTEPLKWKVRDLSVQVVSHILTLRSLGGVDVKIYTDKVAATLSELFALIKIAVIGGQISQMNGSVVQSELLKVFEDLEKIQPDQAVGAGLALPKDFFAITTPAASLFSPVNFSFPQASVKGQYRTNNPIKDTAKDIGSILNVKDTRKDAILKMLKAGGSLGIKDFAKEIKDCSEKTLQRELLALVEQGEIKKTGERRWSVYSLSK